MDAILPGIKPTGQRVELPHAMMVGLEDGKVAYEHIYLDQGSALYQLGLLPQGLPVVGAEAAQRLRRSHAGYRVGVTDKYHGYAGARQRALSICFR